MRHLIVKKWNSRINCTLNQLNTLHLKKQYFLHKAGALFLVLSDSMVIEAKYIPSNEAKQSVKYL